MQKSTLIPKHNKPSRVVISMIVVAAFLVMALPLQAETNQEGSSNPAVQEKSSQDALAFKGKEEKQSYAVGMNFGNQIRNLGMGVNMDLLIKGIQDAHSGNKPILTENEVHAVVKEMKIELKQKQANLMIQKRVKNKQEGETFLAENKTREGIVTLESGLQYKILKAGNGSKPTINDKVVSHFHGTLINGTEFASTTTKDKPRTFSVKGVVQGWREALLLMPVGSKWQVFIPSQLAYGEKGAGQIIGPNSTLIVDVELIAIEDTQAAALTNIKVAFKHETPPTHGGYATGKRWVSPPTYTASVPNTGKMLTVEVKANGFDTKGRPINGTRLEWKSSDPDMVMVSPSAGPSVKITVQRAGESTVQVASAGVSRTLSIKATKNGKSLSAVITQ